MHLNKAVITNLWAGKIVGELDTYEERNSTITVKWKSSVGQVYTIKPVDLLNMVKKDAETWSKFCKHWNNKENLYNSMKN